MARIRTIKPEFPQSESMGRVSREARLLFILLWTLCDDEGRTRAASRMLASLLYPYDDDAPQLIDGWLAELERENCIRRYVVDGCTYLEVCNWLTHQKIDRPGKSKLPPFSESSRALANPREPSSLDQGRDQGKDHGEERESGARAPAPSKRVRSLDEVTVDAEAEAIARAHGVDPHEELAKFRDWYRAHGKTLKDYRAGFHNWLRKAGEFVRERGPQTAISRPTVSVGPSGVDWAARMAKHKPGSFWPPSWGPPPDDPDCECPRDILEAWKRSHSLLRVVVSNGS